MCPHHGSDFPHSANYTPFRGSFPHGPFRILLSAFRNSAFFCPRRAENSVCASRREH